MKAFLTWPFIVSLSLNNQRWVNICGIFLLKTIVLICMLLIMFVTVSVSYDQAGVTLKERRQERKWNWDVKNNFRFSSMQSS